MNLYSDFEINWAKQHNIKLKDEEDEEDEFIDKITDVEEQNGLDPYSLLDKIGKLSFASVVRRYKEDAIFQHNKESQLCKNSQ